MNDLRQELGVILPGPGWEGLQFRKGTWKERELAKQQREAGALEDSEKEAERLREVEVKMKDQVNQAAKDGNVAVAPGN